MPQAILDELRSVEETARRLGGVSKWSIYAWMSQGLLRKTKVGSRVMIRESDLQNFLASCNPQPSEEGAFPAASVKPAKPILRQVRQPAQKKRRNGAGQEGAIAGKAE